MSPLTSRSSAPLRIPRPLRRFCFPKAHRLRTLEAFLGFSVQTRAAPAGACGPSPTQKADAKDPGPERHVALLSLPGTQALQPDRPGLRNSVTYPLLASVFSPAKWGQLEKPPPWG